MKPLRVYIAIMVEALPDDLVTELRKCGVCRGGNSSAVWACDDHSGKVARAYAAATIESKEVEELMYNA